MEIKTFIGRKLNYINGILRRQVEIDRHLKERKNLQLTYEYYREPKNLLDFIAKRHIIYPLYSKRASETSQKDSVNQITFQYLGDLGYFLDPSKTMITCHDVFTFLTRGNLKRPWILQKYLLQGLKKCRYIIAISNFTKNEITTKLNIPKEKIVVIKNGVNREMFHPLSDEKLGESPPLYPKYKKILHVGSEEHRKNFRTLLKAFYLVKKKRDNIKLIRIGTPQHMDLIKSLNLVNDVIYLSDISNKRLLEIYNLCDLLIFPSLYEGWGAPGVEAAACGLPVVCSNIPVFKEIYKDFPEYFQPFDYKTLAEKVLKLLSNKNLKEIMVKKGFKVVKNYNWKESSNKYLKLAKNILNNG